MSVFGCTGHRTDGIFGRYDESDRLRLVGFAEMILVEQKPDTVISGFAIGWDQAVSEAALRLGIDLVAAIPFVGQESKWSKEDRARYNEHMAKALHVEVVCTGGFEPWKFQRRNEVVVDTCDLLGTLFSGAAGSGTKNCIDYATKVQKPMLHLWHRWCVWCGERRCERCGHMNRDHDVREGGCFSRVSESLGPGSCGCHGFVERAT